MRPKARWLAPAAVAAMAAALLAPAAPAGGDDAADREAAKKALAAFADYVGEWKGAGMPRRGSARGAWHAEMVWSWRFEAGRAALAFVAPEGKRKYFREGVLAAGEAAGTVTLTATPPEGEGEGEGEAMRFTGKPDADGVLVLEASEPGPEDRPGRVSIKLVADGARMVILLEGKRDPGGWKRIAELGLTRKGSGFGKGGGGVECVVTGGKGTIPVQHQGRTYYVCCTGCRDLFELDPEGELEAYRKRKAEERAAEKKEDD